MIAIIDGDVLAHLSCDPRKQIGGTVPVIELDENGKKIQYQRTEEENREHIGRCWSVFQRKLNEVVESLFCDQYLMAMKGVDNFRDIMYVDYKIQRKSIHPSKMNLAVPYVRQLAVAKGLAVSADGYEADDFIRIWAEEATIAGHEYIICTVDKDLLCIPGKHYHIRDRTVKMVTEVEARLLYYRQLLQGDPTDNIPGLPGVGPVAARNLLTADMTEEEMQEVVVSMYLQAFGERWYDYLLSNGKMIHILRHKYDYFCFDDWPIVKELV